MLNANACMKYVDEKHYCKYCNTLLSCCNTPPFHVGDGLGWGTDIFFVCLNDECSLFANGWEQVDVQYGHTGSFRYVLLPGNTTGEAMMVGGRDAFKGCEIDLDAMKKQDTRYAEEKKATALLDTCVAEKNLAPVLHLITNEAAAPEARHQAADLLIELNDLACIDPIRNHTFRNTDLEQKTNMAIIELLKANFKKECPYCSEIIKAQAKTCMHCNKDV
ncbi:MAG: zinc ribbon domain-containing protein [Proteobacteria bacterium]|nr:zinc ribbon domain-containing protein [Pseudomonadota bacterium]